MKPDCAYCRHSEWKPVGFQCKKGLPMDAPKCPEFRDSREQANRFVEFPK